MNSYNKVKINEIAKLINRQEKVNPEKDYSILGIKWYAKGLFHKYTKRGSEIKAKSLNLVKTGDFLYSRLFAWKGSFAYATQDFDSCYVSDEFPIFEIDKNKIFPEYLLLFFSQEKIWNLVNDLSSGGTAISRNRFKIEKFLDYPLELPTLEEQKEIINKYKKILSEYLYIQNSLTNDFSNLNQLRQNILQDAVQGKLVPQDSNDEPASELLKKIKTEKEKLIKDGKIKKEKTLQSIKNEEVPYELPKGWEWTSLLELGEINPRNILNDDIEVSFIPMALISDKFGVWPKYELKKWGSIKKGFTHFGENDVVLAKITPCFENSKAGIMKNLKNNYGAGTTELHVFRGNAKYILPEFVYIFIKSANFLKEGKSKMTGSAGQKRVPTDYFAKKLFPLPPHTEQKRIVEKVDRLMKLCDELEEKIKESQKNADLLMQAVLQESFENKQVNLYQSYSNLG